jgi:hypothetical protein
MGKAAQIALRQVMVFSSSCLLLFHALFNISGPFFLTFPTSGLQGCAAMASDSNGLSRSIGGRSESRSSHLL